MAPRSASGRALHAELLRSGLEVKLDDEGRIQVKCRPMFERELRRILRDISDTARDIVRHEHEKPRMILVGRRAVMRPSTGRLRRSIHPDRTIKGMAGGHRIYGSVSAGSRLAPYARYVHEGTRRHFIRARPGGALAFWGHHAVNGRTTYTRDVKRMMTTAQIESLPPRERDRARRSRASRGAGGRLRYSDADVYTDTQTHSYAQRVVVVDQVNHPGYRGNRFLNVAAARVVSGRYGGRVNLPRRSGR